MLTLNLYLNKIDAYHNNPKKVINSKSINKHAVSKSKQACCYSTVTHCPFGGNKNKHDYKSVKTV